MSFVTANYGFAWELWELQHKVIFDGPNKLITVGPETSIIDVKIDLYSDWKEWAMAAENMKWAAAFRSVGGDALAAAATATVAAAAAVAAQAPTDRLIHVLPLHHMHGPVHDSFLGPLVPVALL